MTFFIQTLVINGKIFPSPLVLRTRGSGKILPLITRVCMKNVSIDVELILKLTETEMYPLNLALFKKLASIKYN